MLAVLISTLLGLQFVTYSDQATGVRFGSRYELIEGCPENYTAGVEVPQEGCTILRCNEDSAEYVGCGTFQVEHDPASCYVRYDLERDYPDCCWPILVCAGDEGYDEIQLGGE